MRKYTQFILNVPNERSRFSWVINVLKIFKSLFEKTTCSKVVTTLERQKRFLTHLSKVDVLRTHNYSLRNSF